MSRNQDIKHLLKLILRTTHEKSSGKTLFKQLRAALKMKGFFSPVRFLLAGYLEMKKASQWVPRL